MDKLRGHDIEKINDEWCYSDDTTLTVTNWKTRPCGYCNKHNTLEGHDGCLGTLPNVMNACCGHGVSGEAYIQFDEGKIMRGIEAIQTQQLLKSN